MPYAGAAWEYEFDSEAKYSIYNLTAGTPSLGGNTGIFEVGVSTKSSQYQDIALDFAVETYIGVREGVGGKVQLAYEF